MSETELIDIEIDKRPYKAEKRKKLIDVLKGVGIVIPSLCYHPLLKCTGSCRSCLIVKNGKEVLACQEQASDGDSLKVFSQDVGGKRRFILGILSSFFPKKHRGYFSPRRFDSHFFPKKHTRYYTESQEKKVSKDLYFDSSLCIGCGLCPDFMERFDESGFSFDQNKVQIKGTLEFNFKRNLVEICPTGAFYDRSFLKGDSLKKLKKLKVSIPGEKEILLKISSKNVIRVSPFYEEFIKDSIRDYFEKATKEIVLKKDVENEWSKIFAEKNIEAFIIDNLLTHHDLETLKSYLREKPMEVFYSKQLEVSPFTGFISVLKRELNAKVWSANSHYKNIAFLASDFYSKNEEKPKGAILLSSNTHKDHDKIPVKHFLGSFYSYI